MRIAVGVMLLVVLLVGSGCACCCHTVRNTVEWPGTTLHNLIWAQSIYWEARDFEMYAKDMEDRVNRGEDISAAEYRQFVHAERMHWHVYVKTKE